MLIYEHIICGDVMLYTEKKKLESEITKLQSSNHEIKKTHSAKLEELNNLQKLYSSMQRSKNQPSSEVNQLKTENEEIKRQLSSLTQTLDEQKRKLDHKNDEISSMQEMISSLNKEILKKDKKLATIKSKKDEEIIELKMELRMMADKYEKLNIEHTKQQKLLKAQQRENNNRSSMDGHDSSTKNSRYEEDRELFNGNSITHSNIDDDTKYDFAHNDEIKTPHSIDNTTEDTPISDGSDSVSVESVNSASDNDNDGYDELKTIIIDNGSETIKIGYGSSDDSHKPSKKFHSIIGRPKRNFTNIYAKSNEELIGDEAYSKSSVMDITNVVQRGNVTDWDNMEKLWDYTFYKKLALSQKKGLTNFNVLLTEPVLNKKENREKATQLMFESYDVNSFYIANEAVLSLYGTGKTTGCVLGIGYGVTYSTAIYDSMIIPASTIKINSAGYDLSKYLRQLLSEKYSRVLKSAQHSVVKDMKQKYCFVAENFHDALKQNANSYKKYKLPDGQCIRIGNERFRACEQLFGGFINLNNEEMGDDNKKLFNKNAAFNNSGIHHMINQSIRCVNADDLKQEFYQNIVLSGGSTLFKGLTARLKTELAKITDESCNIVANEKRKYLAWIGGSIISSLTHFQQQFITKDEYEEHGQRIVHNKCIQ